MPSLFLSYNDKKKEVILFCPVNFLSQQSGKNPLRALNLTQKINGFTP